MANSTTFQLLKRLWRHISPRRHAQYVFLLGLMVLAAFSEVVSIGAVLPFLGVLIAPEQIFGMPAFEGLIKSVGLTEPKQLALPIAILFGICALIAGALRFSLMYFSSRVSFGSGSELSVMVYYKTLHQPYPVHCSRNSSEVISGISVKTKVVCFEIILPVAIFISSSLMLVAILGVLFLLHPLVTLIVIFSLSFVYLTIIQLSRRLLYKYSQVSSRGVDVTIKTLQEGLGGIRDILLNGNQESYRDIYQAADTSLRGAQSSSYVITYGPRYLVEALGIFIIAMVALFLFDQEIAGGNAIPILGALAMGAQRLLPLAQQLYGSWSQIKAHQVELEDILSLLDQPLPYDADKAAPNPLPFISEINLNNISFQHLGQRQWVFQELNLKIKRGARVGFIGTTGSGKSTLMDIIMGLLLPTKGSLEVDGRTIGPINYRAWQVHIAHVPQAIFLSDVSIEENIAFGVPKNSIDRDRVRDAATQAQIADLIDSWVDGYKTVVGERGVRLSGGQRQRVGIARALYKNADVIIFDEATSALDNETELAVMDSIEGLSKDLTLLIIAHRLTTLKSCNQIVELGGGTVQRIGTYSELIASGNSVENCVLSSS